MDFKKEREMLKEVNRSIDLMKCINYEVAQYANERIELDAYSENHNLFRKTAITTTNHNEYVFVRAEYERGLFFKKSYYSELNQMQFDYKMKIVEQLLEEVDFFTEENYEKMINDEEYDENFWLFQDSYYAYIIAHFGESYINYIKNEIQDNMDWGIKTKNATLDDTDWDWKMLLPKKEDIFEKKKGGE